jgi:2'-hydroxyisoflavone reductase
MHMPVWVPPSDAEFGGMGGVDVGKAIAAGLTFRPLADTIAATLAWWHELPAERRETMRAGITAARETEVLAKLGEKPAKLGLAPSRRAGRLDNPCINVHICI